MEETPRPLLRVCRLLNEHNVRYVVAGAWAMILNSVVRATEDIDILIASDRDNYQKVIDALSLLADGAARELSPQDFEENVVIKIADEVEVDVTTSAVPMRETLRMNGLNLPKNDAQNLLDCGDSLGVSPLSIPLFSHHRPPRIPIFAMWR